MTRDEAIKVMRTGKKVTHRLMPNNTFDINLGLCELYCRCGIINTPIKIAMLFEEKFDHGWETVKEKKKVTVRRWFGVSKTNLNLPNAGGYETWTYTTEEEAKGKGNPIVVPVDITFEIEE
jgi:hypothetical protein